jgi:hypothetical protein
VRSVALFLRTRVVVGMSDHRLGFGFGLTAW